MKSGVVIGGGIVGLATAIRLRERFPDAVITVIEKEPRVGMHQTGHNSGVLHCGLYYKPGSAKARLAVEGIRQMVEFCQRHRVPHEICGKLVVAATDEEVPRLRELESRGTANGLRGLEWLSRDQMREIEPHVGGVAGLRVPEEGIVDYAAVCAAMVREIEAAGSSVLTNCPAGRIERRGGEWVAGGVTAEWLINCAGLHSDRVAERAGSPRTLRIVPFRGEYYTLRRERAGLVRNLIYPVPDPKFPFLGVHFTRMIHGGVEAGPNAVLAFAREGYRKSDVRAADLWDALSYPGTWRFLARYPRMCWAELRRSFSRELFCASLQRLVPEIRADDLEPGQAGVRAQALEPSGNLVQDFAFADGPNAVHVLNAPSPGATASLAIGQAIVDRITRTAPTARG